MNQTVKADAGKPRLTLVPMQILFDVAEVREYGNAKYPEGGSDNWKRVEPERYREAMLRHILAYIDDPNGVDAESGISHLKHLACNVAFLCWMEEHQNQASPEPEQKPEEPDTPCPVETNEPEEPEQKPQEPRHTPEPADQDDVKVEVLIKNFNDGDVTAGLKRVITKRCKECGAAFTTGSNRAILCPACKRKKETSHGDDQRL